MASRNGGSFSASKVVILLEQDKECLDEELYLISLADLEGESAIPKVMVSLKMGLPLSYLAPGGTELLQTIETITPAVTTGYSIQC